MFGFQKNRNNQVRIMSREIVRISKEDICKLDKSNFIDIEKTEKGLMAGTVIYAAFEDGDPAGIVTLEPVGSIFRTSYFFVAEMYRRKGIGTELARAVRSYDPKIYIDDDMQGYETMLAAFCHMGIGLVSEMIVYRFERCQETMDVCMDLINERGLDIMDMLRRHGYMAVKMRLAPDDVIEKLGEEIAAGYDEDKNPFNVKELDLDWSYIVVKDGFPAAFIACVKEDGNLRIEQLAAHSDYRMIGPAMLAMLTVIERVMVDRKVSSVETGVTTDDDEMKRLIEAKLIDLVSDTKQVKVYALV